MPEYDNRCRHRIMIVDDDQLTALALMRVLKADGLNILALARGSQALEEIRVNAYSLVFLEINIADGTGLTVLREISRCAPWTCIVVMSAGMTDGDTQNTIMENNHYFLPKPFEVLQVRAMTNRILSDASRETEDPVSAGEADGKKRASARHQVPGEITIFPEEEGSFPHVPSHHVARMVDLSPGGMGIQTDLPLPPGQVFRLHGDEGTSKGVVRWSMVFENCFRAGIKFV